jgi:hypothetical protein
VRMEWERPGRRIDVTHEGGMGERDGSSHFCGVFSLQGRAVRGPPIAGVSRTAPNSTLLQFWNPSRKGPLWISCHFQVQSQPKMCNQACTCMQPLNCNKQAVLAVEEWWTLELVSLKI